MEPLDYLKVLRRRWWVAVGVLAAALGFAVATLPAKAPAGSLNAPGVTSYTATHTLLQAPEVQTPVNLDLTQLFATAGEVPRKAAVRLGLPADQGAVLASTVVVTTDKNVSAMRITVTDRDGAKAARVANAFATEVQEFLRASAARDRAAEAAALQVELNTLTRQVLDIQRQLLGNPLRAPLLEAQRAAFTSRYQAGFERLQALQGQSAAGSPLTTLSAATPVPVIAQGSPVPTSRTGRLGLALVVGLVLGLAGALAVDRLDTRLRTRDEVEQHSRLPVVAEVPLLSRSDRRSSRLVSRTAPRGAAAEAYRGLRSALLLIPSRPVVLDGNVDPVVVDITEWRPPAVVLVTSPAPSDGKTSTVVNLATALAESGRSVIVLDADFRRPMAGAYLGVPRSTGLAELLSGEVHGGLTSVLRHTDVPGVRLVTAGSSSRHPASLLSRLGEIVDAACALAEVVLIDSAPLLVANDATDIVPYVDTVLVVARAGRTTSAQARRMSEQLARLGAPVLGVVLQGVRDAGTGGAYYYYSGKDAEQAPVEPDPASPELLPERSQEAPSVPDEAAVSALAAAAAPVVTPAAPVAAPVAAPGAAPVPPSATSGPAPEDGPTVSGPAAHRPPLVDSIPNGSQPPFWSPPPPARQEQVGQPSAPTPMTDGPQAPLHDPGHHPPTLPPTSPR